MGWFMFAEGDEEEQVNRESLDLQLNAEGVDGAASAAGQVPDHHLDDPGTRQRETEVREHASNPAEEEVASAGGRGGNAGLREERHEQSIRRAGKNVIEAHLKRQEEAGQKRTTIQCDPPHQDPANLRDRQFLR